MDIVVQVHIFENEVCHDNIQILLNAMITMVAVATIATTLKEALNAHVMMATK